MKQIFSEQEIDDLYEWQKKENEKILNPILTEERINELLKKPEKIDLFYDLKYLLYKIKRWLKYGNRNIFFD